MRAVKVTSPHAWIRASMTDNDPSEALRHIDAMSDARLNVTRRAMEKRFPLDPDERIYNIDMHEWYDLLYQEADRRGILSQPAHDSDCPHDCSCWGNSNKPFAHSPSDDELLHAWENSLEV